MRVKIKNEEDLHRMMHINTLAMYPIIEENFKLLIETGVMNDQRKIIREAEVDDIIETVLESSSKVDTLFKGLVRNKQFNDIDLDQIINEHTNLVKGMIFSAITTIKFSALAVMVGATVKNKQLSDVLKTMTEKSVCAISTFGICLEKQHEQIVNYENSTIFTQDDVLPAVELIMNRTETSSITLKRGRKGVYRVFVVTLDGQRYSYPEKTVSQFEICIYDQDNFDKMTADKLSFVEKANQERYGSNRKYMIM